MKVVIFTYKSLKDLLGKPSEDATRKWADSRNLQRRNRENSNVKEVLVPYEMYQKLWELAGKPQDYSNPPTEDIFVESEVVKCDNETNVNAMISSFSPNDKPDEFLRNPYVISKEFTDDFIRELSKRNSALMVKNDALYNKILELTRYQERAELLESEMKKKDAQIEKYDQKMQQLNQQLREYDAVKLKVEIIKQLSSLKDEELSYLKEKIEKLNILNNKLQKELENERNKPSWIKKLIGN